MNLTGSSSTGARVEIRGAERLLLIDGQPAKIGARAFDVLQLLAQRREGPVSKNELLAAVWPNTVVEENNLQVQVSTLRKLLGPQAITTVPGRGYQFTAAFEDATAGAGDVKGETAVERASARATVLAAARITSGNLPDELPALYGRAADLAALRALLGAHRFVSIVGAAGIGKTVLAQSLAHGLRTAFDDGVWWIELAPVSDPATVALTVAAPLGLQGSETDARAIAERLRSAECLLVLDNCEHLLEPVAELVRAVLRQAPGVQVVATSQEPLKLVDEQIYRLDALSLPDDGDADGVRTAGAVALFVARAQAADPRVVLSAEKLPAVVDICRQLDGLPLAIELAAARVPLLGIDGLRARLGERLRLLTAGHRLALRRHQTLRAALEWSHGLLTAAEQSVFRRLGVFVASFDLARAQQVTADANLDEWSVLDQLGGLVDKSLVMAQPGDPPRDPPRYRLLESGRACALEKLHESGETEATMNRHLQAMLSLFEQGQALHWTVPDQVLRDRHAHDLDNLRAALDWAAHDGADPAPLIALAGASAWIWEGALLPEGQRRCALAISRIDAGTPKAHAVRLLFGYALAAHPKASPTEIDAIERGIALARETGDRHALYFGLSLLVFRFTKLGRLDEAWRAASEAQALQASDWPPGLLPHLTTSRAHLHHARGDYAAAAADKLASLRAYELLGDQHGIRVAQMNLADIALARDEVDEAVRLGRELVAAARREPRAHQVRYAAGFGNLCAALTRAGALDEAQQVAREAIALLRRRASVHLHLDHLALLALRMGRVAHAARALGRARAVSDASGDALEINEQRAHNEALSALQQMLAGDELERLFAEGAALSDEDAASAAVG